MAGRFTRVENWATYGAFANKLTTVDTYADVGSLDCLLAKTKHFVFTATTNNLQVAVLGSIDGGATYPYTLETNIAVNAAATVTKTYTTPYTHLKVQVKPAVGGSHGTLASNYMLAAWG